MASTRQNSAVHEGDRGHQWRYKFLCAAVLAPHHPQAQAQKAREKREVLQVGEHANLCGHPPNEDYFRVESHRTDKE
jgi:hypothetical protein